MAEENTPKDQETTTQPSTDEAQATESNVPEESPAPASAPESPVPVTANPEPAAAAEKSEPAVETADSAPAATAVEEKPAEAKGVAPEENVDATKVADPKEAERIARSASRRRSNPGRRPAPADDSEESGLTEKVVFINRCAKVVKGGRRFSFSALVVVGDGQGQVGIGFGKANEVAECIRKANEDGRKNMQKVNLEESTIPHEVLGVHGSSKVFMRPASVGTGLIAGGGVRAVAEAAGVKDLLAKSLGSDNPSNVAKAALNGLSQLAYKEEFLQARGKN